MKARREQINSETERCFFIFPQIKHFYGFQKWLYCLLLYSHTVIVPLSQAADTACCGESEERKGDLEVRGGWKSQIQGRRAWGKKKEKRKGEKKKAARTIRVQQKSDCLDQFQAILHSAAIMWRCCDSLPLPPIACLQHQRTFTVSGTVTFALWTGMLSVDLQLPTYLLCA